MFGINLFICHAPSEQLRLNQIFNGTTFHVPLDKYGSIPPAAFAIHPVRTLRFFSEAVQDRGNGLDGFKLHNGFCTTVQIEMALGVTENLVAEFAARKRVPLLDEPIIAASVSVK